MELDTPDPLAALRSRDDTLDGGVVTVDEEWSPTLREVLGKSKSVLMVLGLMERYQQSFKDTWLGVGLTVT